MATAAEGAISIDAVGAFGSLEENLHRLVAEYRYVPHSEALRAKPTLRRLSAMLHGLGDLPYPVADDVEPVPLCRLAGLAGLAPRTPGTAPDWRSR